LRLRHVYKIDNRPRITRRDPLCHGSDGLMPNVFGRSDVNGVLRNIRRVIADTFETT
jgi:hypothetical protein